VGHAEKVVDFGWRAVHEMTTTAKRIITSHYDQAPRFSYWTGCSAGGRQAMKAAQRFPEDFNGIVAGAPGLDWTSRAARAVQVEKALQANPDARLLPPARQLLHAAVVAACDAHDGVKDGLIENPHHCQFDPGVLECRGAADGSCLSKAQVETARLMYADVVHPRTKRIIAGLAPGSELGWTDLGWTASARATGLDQFRFIVFGDPTWAIDKFNVDIDVAQVTDHNHKPFSCGEDDCVHGWSVDLSVERHSLSSACWLGRAAKMIRVPAVAPGMCLRKRDQTPAPLLEQWSSTGGRPIRSWHRIRPRASWIARGRCVPIPRLRPIRARAASTKPRTSRARHRSFVGRPFQGWRSGRQLAARILAWVIAPISRRGWRRRRPRRSSTTG
jgi:hypothetical protein